MTVRVLVHAEDALADAIARELLDRAVHQEAKEEWLRELWSPEAREAQRRFEAFTVSPPEGSRRITPHPRDPRTNRGLKGNAALAYHCMRHAAVQRAADEEVLLLLAYDTDHRDPEQRCRHGVAVAMATAETAPPAVVAEATPEFDAWVLAGCDVGAQPYKHRHAELCARLRSAGFAIDPVRAPHQLQSKTADDPRDAKTLASALLGIDGQAGPEHPEARRCWEESPLEQLRELAGDAGVSDFFAEVQREVPRCYRAAGR